MADRGAGACSPARELAHLLGTAQLEVLEEPLPMATVRSTSLKYTQRLGWSLTKRHTPVEWDDSCLTDGLAHPRFVARSVSTLQVYHR